MPKYRFRKHPFGNYRVKGEFDKTVNEMKKIFSDHEIKLLLFWLIIGPLFALAYLVWKKYTRFRIVAIVLFFISMLYFIGQLGGWWYIVSRLFR